MKRPNNLSHFFWLLASLIVGLSWTSCSKEDAPVIDTPTDAGAVASTVTQDQPFLSETEAKTQATDLYAALFPESLRSGTTPKVKSVRLLDPFRSTQDSAGGIYVVNFENDGGYIMMAEHRYGEPILAACPKGNFYPEKALENPNFVPILANMRALVSSSRCPSKPGSCPEVDDEVRIYEGAWETIEEVTPLIPVNWGQREPFNLYAPVIDNKLAPAGCVPTAVAHILSYYKQPQSLEWERLIVNTNVGRIFLDPYTWDTIGKLFKELGTLLKVNYGSNGSGAYTKDVPDVLNHYGISCSKTPQNYSWEKVNEDLNKQRPIYISASEFKYTTTLSGGFWYKDEKVISYSEGHAWVIDGLKVIKRKITKKWQVWEEPYNSGTSGWKQMESSRFEERNLVHCNFGWTKYDTANTDPDYNGYYLSGIFDTEDKPNFRSATHPEGRSGYYQFLMRILTDITLKQ